MNSGRQKDIDFSEVSWLVLLALLGSVVITWMGADHVFQIWRAYQFGGRTDGVVVANRIATTYPQMYHLHIEYIDQYDRTRTFEDTTLRKEKIPEGTHIQVVYDKKDPRSARLASDKLYVPQDFFLLLFGGFCWILLYWDVEETASRCFRRSAGGRGTQ